MREASRTLVALVIACLSCSVSGYQASFESQNDAHSIYLDISFMV
jgi:hypothetical protein